MTQSTPEPGQPRRLSVSRRGFLGATIATVGGLTLSACGGSGGKSTTGTGRSSTGASAGAVRGGGATMWGGGMLAKSKDGVIIKKESFIYIAGDNFKQETGIDIKQASTSGDITAAAAQFKAASIAGNGPEMRCQFTGGGTTSFAQYLEPLDSVFGAEEQAKLKGWDTVRQNLSPSGKILALPFGAGSYFFVYYRPSLLAKAGVNVDKLPTTWEELLDFAQRVKDGGVTPFWVANQEGYLGAWVIAALAGGLAGSTVFLDQYNGTAKIDSPEMIAAYKAYADLYGRGLCNKDAASQSNDNAQAGLIQGKAAMFINGGWNNATLYDGLKDDVACFPIPTLAASKVRSVIAGGPNIAISVTNYAKNKPQAIEFLKYLSRPDVIDLYVKLNQTEASNNIDSDTSVITNPLLKKQAEELKSQQTVFPFDNVMPQDVIDLFYRLNATAFTGRTSAEDACRQLQKKFDSAKAAGE